jgi:transposase
MARPLVPDELWAVIGPLLPPPPKPRFDRYPGRKRVDDRKALTGILFILKTGLAWEDLPVEMGCGSGMTCWRRLQEWQQAGVWPQVYQVLLAHGYLRPYARNLAADARFPTIRRGECP